MITIAVDLSRVIVVIAVSFFPAEPDTATDCVQLVSQYASERETLSFTIDVGETSCRQDDTR